MIPLVSANSNDKHHLCFHPPLTHPLLSRLLGHLPFQTLSVLPECISLSGLGWLLGIAGVAAAEHGPGLRVSLCAP